MADTIFRPVRQSTKDYLDKLFNPTKKNLTGFFSCSKGRFAWSPSEGWTREVKVKVEKKPETCACLIYGAFDLKANPKHNFIAIKYSNMVPWSKKIVPAIKRLLNKIVDKHKDYFFNTDPISYEQGGWEKQVKAFDGLKNAAKYVFNEKKGEFVAVR